MFAELSTVTFVDKKSFMAPYIGLSKEIYTMLEDSSSTTNRQTDRGSNTIANLYRYSDLSVDAIARQVDMDVNDVQKVVDDLIKNDALEVVIDQSATRVEKIMTPIVITLDCSKLASEAAALMAQKEIGSIIVTKEGRPFGIVTHSDIVRWAGLRQQLLNVELEGIANRPLISIGRGATVEDAAKGNDR